MLVWSYSMLDMFETCPRKWHDKYILKNKEPETEALRYGNYVHGSIEKYLKGQSDLPTDLLPNRPLVESVKLGVGELLTEKKMGITEKLGPTEFFGTGVWGRGAADVIKKQEKRAFLGDWKTGKRKDKSDQLEILSLFLFKHFPDLQTVSGCNIWLKSNEIGNVYHFYKHEEEQMWVRLLKRLQPMYEALKVDMPVEKPSYLCGYCPVKACKFNKT